MKIKRTLEEKGNILLCVLGTILVVSLIGATVLHNSITRLNASSNQVRAWKESLSAAETGGEIGFAEIRKALSDPATQATQWTGWTNSGTTHVSPSVTFGAGNLKAQTVVEACWFDNNGVFHLGANPNPGANSWYRLRSKGIAPVPGLKRSGMDDTLFQDNTSHFRADGSARGKGDSLLRKIDFKYDHFVATYGPNGDGLNKAQVAPVVAPSISRRIEQIVRPVTPFFDAAIQALGDFYGLGSAAYIDSYDSRNGPYDPTIKDNPTSPYFKDARHGSVQIGSSVATIKGMLYGDVATNGGTIVNSSQITGTIDNNVPFTLPDYHMPDTTSWLYQPPGDKPGQLPSAVTSNNQSLTPPVTGTQANPTYYVITALSGALTVNPVSIMVGSPPVAIPQDTFVAIRVADGMGGGDITGRINVNGAPNGAAVKLKIYFEGNFETKNSNLVNVSPSAVNPYAGNLQFYGISPPRDPKTGLPTRTQTIQLDSGNPGTLAATFYAPSADVVFKGNPDFIGITVCKTFYGNGNITWHYDRKLNDDGELLDFRIASYVEDPR